MFKTAWGVLGAALDVFDVYPDVIFSKGGYGSFPTLVAARILRIPVVMHESDSAPGRVNKWSGKFASRIALSYKEASSYFKEDKIAYTGQPILAEKSEPLTHGAHEFFGFDQSVPTIFVIGGSQGAETINNAVIDVLPELLEHYQIIHQTGQSKFEVVKETASAVLLDNPNKNRYKPYPYLYSLEMRMAAGAADLVISRGGSSIFEIAAWQKPSIIIPIADSNENHQVKNAFAYAKYGACSVLREENLKSSIFLSEINKIMGDKELQKKMAEGAKAFWKPGAADQIALELLSIVLSHEEL
jgi:UDP-N-acetylglucosamine--N-acetylmuramyl-(pentapeptide) pyrophosphoryl-undecaprenol N-acetylglucosamine transferase